MLVASWIPLHSCWWFGIPLDYQLFLLPMYVVFLTCAFHVCEAFIPWSKYSKSFIPSWNSYPDIASSHSDTRIEDNSGVFFLPSRLIVWSWLQAIYGATHCCLRCGVTDHWDCNTAVSWSHKYTVHEDTKACAGASLITLHIRNVGKKVMMIICV